MTAADARNEPETHDEDDDDAFRWEGDDQLGRASSAERRARVGAAVDRGDAEPEAGESGVLLDPGESASDGALRAVATGLFGILYLAYTVGWILSVQQGIGAATVDAQAVLEGFGDFLALVAAGVWFAGVLALTAESRLAVRVGWLAVGAGVLVPWPIVIQLAVRA